MSGLGFENRLLTQLNGHTNFNNIYLIKIACVKLKRVTRKSQIRPAGSTRRGLNATQPLHTSEELRQLVKHHLSMDNYEMSVSLV